MNIRFKFVAALAVCVLLVAAAVALLGAIILGELPDAQRMLVRAALADNAGALLLVFLLLAAVFAMLLQAAIRAYVARPLALSEETRLISGANPRHRLECAHPSELAQLASSINELAQRHESLQAGVEARVAEANREIEKERNLLAALMADLTESVVVFNAAGSILLYNQRARQLFDGATDADRLSGVTDWIGLGRSIFGSIDREVIVHALDQLNHSLRKGDRFPVSTFVTATRGGRLLRARMTGVANDTEPREEAREWSAFVVVLEDIQREVQLGATRERVLTSLTEGTRASLASIRAAAEAIMHYPAMESVQQRRFLSVIHDEAEKLGNRLHDTLTDDASGLAAEWPLTPMLGRDLLRALQHAIEERCGGTVSTRADDAPLWLAVDSFLLVEGLSHLVHRVERRGVTQERTLRLVPNGTRVKLELSWREVLLDVDRAIELENEPITIPGQPQPLSLRQIVARHGGEAWYQRSETADRSAFYILLPSAEAQMSAPPSSEASGTVSSRPVFYDFDLFRQAGQRPEIDQRPLSELAYTVFDTETTGLQPSQGDQIISIGAVRILNGRLLTGETFEQLVNPRRKIEQASSRIHGLTNAMLENQPDIETVLPRFHRFCGNTVLVAHNAAFDMRFLQLKQDATGVTFAHPVLDTLLLSAAVHPHQTDHSLEAIAARLGVNVIGRHTALGDAMVTGEIFLKLISLLRQKGIVTFRQAQDAAQKTPYAQVQY
ncbi:MAG TPA: exonuclease domain-containing protein [Burkholderiales bacterium]|nr:exonuclease domain-containing protein [Burkholderiales bacterium]